MPLMVSLKKNVSVYLNEQSDYRHGRRVDKQSDYPHGVSLFHDLMTLD